MMNIQVLMAEDGRFLVAKDPEGKAMIFLYSPHFGKYSGYFVTQEHKFYFSTNGEEVCFVEEEAASFAEIFAGMIELVLALAIQLVEGAGWKKINNKGKPLLYRVLPFLIEGEVVVIHAFPEEVCEMEGGSIFCGFFGKSKFLQYFQLTYVDGLEIDLEEQEAIKEFTPTCLHETLWPEKSMKTFIVGPKFSLN